MLTKDSKPNKFIPDEVLQLTTWNNLNHRPVKFDQDGSKRLSRRIWQVYFHQGRAVKVGIASEAIFFHVLLPRAFLRVLPWRICLFAWVTLKDMVQHSHLLFTTSYGSIIYRGIDTFLGFIYARTTLWVMIFLHLFLFV